MSARPPPSVDVGRRLHSRGGGGRAVIRRNASAARRQRRGCPRGDPRRHGPERLGQDRPCSTAWPASSFRTPARSGSPADAIDTSESKSAAHYGGITSASSSSSASSSPS